MDDQNPATASDEQTLENDRPYTELQPLPESDRDAHDLIAGVKVNSDSVVAMLQVTTATGVDQLDVLWGDGTRDTLTSPPGLYYEQQLPPNTDAPTLPQGTYTFYHRYSEGNGDPIQRDIGVYARLITESNTDLSSRSDSASRRVTVTPLYTVHASSVMARLTNWADAPWVESVDFRIEQRIATDVRHTWDWPAPNGEFPDTPEAMLTGSELTGYRMKASDEVPLFYRIEKDHNWLEEIDPTFDFLGQISAHIGPRTEQGSLDKPASDLPIRFRYTVRTELVVPVIPDEQPVVGP